ncbi:MAG: hypothetical protein NC925_01620 [Candidatus Omnitrophica bacterium]|nr:hypothetical protein [Candidatus Omnitrophota bacterium]MCM8831545.1 hypothetical protein [Candidatus Omnitrophota bacterium]
MWLVTTALCCGCATIAKFILPKKLKLGFLALMLWGATIMILIDHLLGYEGGEFLEKTTDGVIKNSTLLGVLMLVPIFLVWLISILVENFKKGGRKWLVLLLQ